MRCWYHFLFKQYQFCLELTAQNDWVILVCFHFCWWVFILVCSHWYNYVFLAGRHFILICGGSRSVQEQTPLVGVRGENPQRFWHFKAVLTCSFVGNMIKFPNKLLYNSNMLWICFSNIKKKSYYLHSCFRVSVWVLYIYHVKHTVSKIIEMRTDSRCSEYLLGPLAGPLAGVTRRQRTLALKNMYLVS